MTLKAAITRLWGRGRGQLMGVTRTGVFVIFAASMATPPLGAHHSFSAEFDVSKPLKLTGTLVKWEVINPARVVELSWRAF